MSSANQWGGNFSLVRALPGAFVVLRRYVIYHSYSGLLNFDVYFPNRNTAGLINPLKQCGIGYRCVRALFPTRGGLSASQGTVPGYVVDFDDEDADKVRLAT